LPRLDAFLKLAREQNCSDVHLAVGVPPMLRMHGDLMPIKFRDLDQRELTTYLTEILTPKQKDHFKESDLDFAYSAEGVGRFRANYFQKSSGPGAVFRYIPPEVPTLGSLNLPPIVRKLIDHQQGMILVTGATGTGKSTTLAAIIDHINASRSDNIISLEDPIEFIHSSKKSQVIQREVGTHVDSFASGLRAALREDPDVILVGEMRDAESVSMAMTAAETGHLVLGTMHTTTAVKTIDRIIDAMPFEQREQSKTFLAQSLLGVLTQVLVKTPDGHGRKAVIESMVMTKAIGKLLMENKSHMIPSQIQTGRNLGMMLMDHALMEAIQAREVDPNDAYQYALDEKPFRRFVTDADLIPQVDLS